MYRKLGAGSLLSVLIIRINPHPLLSNHSILAVFNMRGSGGL